MLVSPPSTHGYTWKPGIPFSCISKFLTTCFLAGTLCCIALWNKARHLFELTMYIGRKYLNGWSFKIFLTDYFQLISTLKTNTELGVPAPSGFSGRDGTQWRQRHAQAPPIGLLPGPQTPQAGFSSSTNPQLLSTVAHVPENSTSPNSTSDNTRTKHRGGSTGLSPSKGPPCR